MEGSTRRKLTIVLLLVGMAVVATLAFYSFSKKAQAPDLPSPPPIPQIPSNPPVNAMEGELPPPPPAMPR